LPFTDEPKFQQSLRLIPHEMREDAMQEAWVAHLSGRCPIAAMLTHARRERKYRRRFSQLTEGRADEDN
jgi:hypothetical protein